MKDYKEVMKFCKGLEPLGKNGAGHTVYGDPTVKGIIFADSAPHNKHISEAYYSEAPRCAEELKAAKRTDVVETFVASPPRYKVTYRYFAVCNICTEIHEVFSPTCATPSGRARIFAKPKKMRKSGLSAPLPT